MNAYCIQLATEKIKKISYITRIYKSMDDSTQYLLLLCCNEQLRFRYYLRIVKCTYVKLHTRILLISHIIKS